MEILITLNWSIKIDGDRANAEEIAEAVDRRVNEAKSPVGQAVIEAYQSQIVQTLCSPSSPSAKKGLGGHEVKGQPGRSCPHRSFRKAGFWAGDRHLRTRGGTIRFRPALIACCRCGRRLTPILSVLQLQPYQVSTVQCQRLVIEAALDSSYRRAVQAPGLSVSKSTAHHWASKFQPPIQSRREQPFLGADGMKFQRQGGTRGEVRLVVEIGRNGQIRPLEVHAGVPWKQIAERLQRRQRRRASQFISDGELAIEYWLGPLGRRCGRCLWHLQRDSRYTLWADHVSPEERRQIRRRLQEMIQIEPPVREGEPLRPEDKQHLRQQIDSARESFQRLHEDLARRGYAKTAQYLARAQDKLFSHLELWLQTGRLGLKTTSIIESLIRELARRLKKLGWNWSDEGATRMGWMVLLRRHDPTAWQRYWQERTNLRGRCLMELVSCDRQAA